MTWQIKPAVFFGAVSVIVTILTGITAYQTLKYWPRAEANVFINGPFKTLEALSTSLITRWGLSEPGIARRS